MEVRYYICKHCGNIVEKVKDKGVPVICCGEPIQELKAGVTDAAVEKHVPCLLYTSFSESMRHRLCDKVAPYCHRRSVHQSQSAQEQDVLQMCIRDRSMRQL